jgi:hypothetical protein
MKVVVNRAIGASFCLSQKALERLCHVKSVNSGSGKIDRDIRQFSLSQDKLHTLSRSIERNDSDLIQVIEELGQDAAGPNVELVIVEIPNDSSWRVSDVVGYEYVVVDGQVH